MKASALYHLMQLRARKLSESLPDNSKTALEAIQKSMKIQRQPGTYIIDWNVNQTDYSLTMESDPFKFYEKGDNPKRNERRGENMDYRSDNWRAALELWRDIFRISNLDTEYLIDDGQLAFGDFPAANKKEFSFDNVVIASACALFSIIYFRPFEVAQLFLVILFLLLFSESFSSVQLRKPLHIVEKLLIALGGMVPLYLGVDQTWIMLNVTALYLLTKAERTETKKQAYYLLSGFCFGVAVYVATTLATIFVFVFSMLLIIISLVDSARFKRINTVLFLLGALVSVFAIYLTIGHGSGSENIASIAQENPADIFMIGNLYFILLFSCFLLWWVTGVQYYLIPWLSLFTISMAIAFTSYTGNLNQMLMLGVFSGFILVITYRVLTSIIYHTSKAVDH